MDLSICIVAYYNYDSIKKAVETLELYTPSDIKKRIYIVDNSISKNICSKFSNFINQYDDVVYIYLGKNVGFGRANNYIIPRLTSKYHCIMNPDILFSKDVFTSIISYMDQNPSVGMVIPNMVDSKGKRLPVYRKELTILDMFIRMFCRSLFRKRQARHTLQYKDYSKPFQVPFAQGSFLVIRTNLLRELKGFDENYFMYMEDADLCKRVNMISSLMYYPNVSVIHKWNKGSHKDIKLFFYHLKSMHYYFKKWGYKWF